jgi:predicted dinucleotide-binding enzyme
MKTTLALFGAAGKMGGRISKRLKIAADFETLYVESGETGMARLRERGDTPADPVGAAQSADVVILAIPDKLIGKISHQVVLDESGRCWPDPAAPRGGWCARPELLRGPPRHRLRSMTIDPEARMISGRITQRKSEKETFEV